MPVDGVQQPTTPYLGRQYQARSSHRRYIIGFCPRQRADAHARPLRNARADARSETASTPRGACAKLAHSDDASLINMVEMAAAECRPEALRLSCSTILEQTFSTSSVICARELRTRSRWRPWRQCAEITLAALGKNVNVGDLYAPLEPDVDPWFLRGSRSWETRVAKSATCRTRST